MSFTDNLKSLPSSDGLRHIELRDEANNSVAIIENKPGQQGSLRVYKHLLDRYGAITAEAAREGLRLYAEHTEDAVRNPGKHPNIDRLLALEASDATLRGTAVSSD